MRSSSIAMTIAVSVLFGSSAASAACHRIKVCDYTMSPPCEWHCVDLFIGRTDAAYSMTFKRLDPKAASAIANELSGIGSAQTSGSSLTVKGLSKSEIPQVLDRLNIDRGAVRVPQ